MKIKKKRIGVVDKESDDDVMSLVERDPITSHVAHGV